MPLTTSTDLGELAKALAAASLEMPTIEKNKTNPHYKNNFADLSAVVETAKPIISKHGLVVTQLPSHDDAGHDTLVTVLLHSSGQWLASEMLLHPVKVDPQAQGSAITYGKRYAYCAVLGLVADEDDDGNAASSPPKKSAPKKPAPQPQSAPPAIGGPDCPLCGGPLAGQPVARHPEGGYAHKECLEKPF